MARTRVGLPGIPARDDPEHAVELLLELGYDACEIDFEGGFWMDYPWAEKLGEVDRAADVALSVHAPLFGFMGHLKAEGRKFSSAVGALDRSAGIAAACGAEVVVFHPGCLLGRSREDAIASVVEQLGTLRERLEGKGRAVPFGVEVMGRVRDLGSLDDVVEISAQTGWVRPVLDFAHMHATSDGAYLVASLFADALEAVDDGLEPGVPFHIHFSDIAYANRNEKHHLPYGEGTLRADPLREALDRFERPATVDLGVAGRGVEPGDQVDPRPRLSLGGASTSAARPASCRAGRRALPPPRPPRRRGRAHAGTRPAPRVAQSGGSR